MSEKRTVTFKVHRAERRGPETKVILHPLDPHEVGENELVECDSDGNRATRSGEGKVSFRVTDPTSLEFFRVGRFVKVTFEQD